MNCGILLLTSFSVWRVASVAGVLDETLLNMFMGVILLRDVSKVAVLLGAVGDFVATNSSFASSVTVRPRSAASACNRIFSAGSNRHNSMHTSASPTCCRWLRACEMNDDLSQTTAVNLLASPGA